MSNIIDSIRLSGVTYGIQGSGGTQTIELTQAEYDALVDKDPNTFYVITDAQAGDLTNYYTKSETNTLLAGKQATLVSGTNIKTINNTSILGSGNIDIQGGGGGKAIEAGRGISITTGETADTVSFNLPISANTYNSIVMGGKINNSFTNNGKDCLMVGSEDTISNGSDFCLLVGYRCSANGDGSAVIGYQSRSTGDTCFAFGYDVSATTSHSFATGYGTITKNNYEHTSGKYNVSNTGSTTADETLFSVGNGTANNARHNAFEIRQNGDIYLTSGSTDIKLQDYLGGGGSSYTAGRGIDITNDTISFNLGVSASTGTNSIIQGSNTVATGESSHSEGFYTYAYGDYSHTEGTWSVTNGAYSHAEGSNTVTNNDYEHASGIYNASNYGSTEADNTLFSIGNGTYQARHNAFEVRQNGDIYYFDGTNDVKLQDKFSSLDTTIGDINTILQSI